MVNNTARDVKLYRAKPTTPVGQDMEALKNPLSKSDKAS